MAAECRVKIVRSMNRRTMDLLLATKTQRVLAQRVLAQRVGAGSEGAGSEGAGT